MIVSWIKQQLKDRIVYVTTPKEVSAMIEALTEPELALDSETFLEKQWQGLGGKETASAQHQATDPHTARVSLVSLKTRSSLPYVVDIIELRRNGWNPQPFIEFLQSKEKILAFNVKFDLQMLRKEFGVVLDNFWDIRVLVKMLHNALGSKFGKRCGASLGDVVRDLLSTPENPIEIEGKGDIQKSNWEVRPATIEQARVNWLPKVEYSAEDIHYLFDLKDLIEPVLRKPLPKTPLNRDGERGLAKDEIGLGMSEVLELEQQAQTAIAEMEWNGLPIAPQATERFYSYLNPENSVEGRLNELAAELYEQLGMEEYLVSVPHAKHRIPKTHSPLRNPQTLKNQLQRCTGLNLDNAQSDTLQRVLELYQELDRVRKGEKDDIDWASEEEEEYFIELYQIEDGQLRENCDLLDKIILYKQLDKVMGMDLRQFINPATGRVHSSYNSGDASTSRSNSFKPNAQQINGKVKLTVPLNKNNPLDQPDESG
ncbi:MAG: hypothetical protein ABEK59_02145 [Halobacteria archaeon]